MISVLVSITALQQRLITLRGGRPHRRWMGRVAGREGGRDGRWSKGKRDLSGGEALLDGCVCR